MRHRLDVAGAGALEAFQLVAEGFGQALGAAAVQPRGEQGEFAATAARRQPVGLAVLGLGALQQAGDFADQRVGALAAQALVEPGQVVQAQQQQVAGGALLAGGQLGFQAGVEQAAVGQAGEAVLVGLLA